MRVSLRKPRANGSVSYARQPLGKMHVYAGYVKQRQVAVDRQLNDVRRSRYAELGKRLSHRCETERPEQDEAESLPQARHPQPAAIGLNHVDVFFAQRLVTDARGQDVV